ncbi:MAG: ribonuclease HI family protein [candidate division NC10 bacterium]|nr:ribonuclease HI family protein [candidate division NC10 bacterium]
MGQDTLHVYIDGASRGNPGPAGVGVVLESEGGDFVGEDYRFIGKATNNTAEYRALLIALEKVRDLGYAKVRIYTDSQLLVRHLNGDYRVRSPSLRNLYQRVIHLRRSFDSFSIQHLERGYNKRADLLANRAINEALREFSR